MGIAVIVPWGTDHGPRERVWEKLRPQWEQTSVDLIVAGDPLFAERGKFSVSRAINRAVRLAPPEYDRFVLLGADMPPDEDTVAWAAVQLDTEPWTLLYDRGRALDEHNTAHFVAGELAEVSWPPVALFASPCVGPIAFTRATFDKVGGFDERYEGWAYEDVDLWYRLQRDTPRSTPQSYSGNPLSQFWHPETHHDLSNDNPNVRLFAETWG
ncbi:glycosyltransferase family 2 protein [Amycolatopsis sp. H20-H5]|uniref:glycosyltransferase family 2 protein n=1 Tax=Amycolatopsis sp. H20-H5 TaxID=3046309 RepID=UPI002DBA2A6B|nr:galactosyltransferase-related protein [Amycolatopsis sp. H20-H5]